LIVTIVQAWLASCLLVSTFATGADAPPWLDRLRGWKAKPAAVTMAWDGTTRQFLIATPTGNGPFPVVVLLHGGTQTAEQVWRQTGLPGLAQRQSFILVAPQGLGKHWNDGRGANLAGDPVPTADDVGFLHALIGDVVAHYHGDRNAVFMVGASNGGFMTMHFACEHADDLRAAASVIANLPKAAQASCRPAKPLPWLAMNGVRDPIVPFAGQAEPQTRRGEIQPALLSADDSFRFWADRAGCGPSVETRSVSGSRQDGTAEIRTRRGCAGGTTSVQYVFTGGGHTWPGMRDGLIQRMLGGVSNAIDGSAAIWDFFVSTLPDR
jgi:polyhydroxybutyrate depolymerase